ncbi:undecaprenyl-phosphate glucose phosphotransferase [Pseudoalteromonas sp. SR43-6]|uniref:undecaprenyl-phosphate glucose phosphotransferase n=2 Tax=Pseudoalteromonas TaxID=53246 RepID=UPI0015FEFF32|nr:MULTISPECIES: undecaprenyl-phosphate glucose phosphotransferase [unclassified Pseudoalteromonas]MBB1372820.1 undecaprenyl-phosphate glucose phosphotransferase [Pseudoalteromonas sp. SR43-6]MBB1412691.1 undecaprenyl-phosphate glucose phosphotransferase [Pseudoalteromonas sp. SG43-8]
MTSSRTFKPTSSSDASFYRLFDIFALFLAFQSSALFYSFESSPYYMVAVLGIALSYLYSAELFSTYRSWRAGKFRTMVLCAWASLLTAFALLVLVSFVFKFSENLSRIGIGLWFLLSIIYLYAWRFIVHMYKKQRRRMGLNLRNVAIVGATESAVYLYDEITKNDELGFKFLGFFDDRKPERLFQNSTKHDVTGKIQDAVNSARNGEIGVLYIALPMKADKRIADILLQLGDTTVDVHIIPDFLMSNLIHARIEHVGDVDTLSVFESPFIGAREFIKRTEDIIVASIILMLISPILIAITFAVKFTSKGPVIFKQDRYGLDGRKIKVWKFRSMTVTENSAVVTQATKNDARITPLGGFLRRTSLDELPQFINVLKGDMSIVGPRPHAVAHNEEYRKKVEFYMLRHKAKPGITGWAQINGWRGETDTLDKMEKRVEFDLHYIKHWSLWFDVKIIFMTIFKGFKNANAY